MEKTYSYKGFEVTVKLVDVRAMSSDFTFGLPTGFIAEVSVCTGEPRRPIGRPIRLVAEGNHAFGTMDDALSAGCSAAQRAIDDRVAS